MSEPHDLTRLVAEAATRDVPLTPETDAAAQPDLSVDLEAYRMQFQLDCLYQEFQHLNDNHKLRLSYTGKIYWLVVVWLVCVVACIAMAGFSALGFHLTDTVLVAFITSTTVNVIGLFVLVAKWMYPANNGVDGKSLQAKITEVVRRDSPKSPAP